MSPTHKWELLGTEETWDLLQVGQLMRLGLCLSIPYRMWWGWREDIDSEWILGISAKKRVNSIYFVGTKAMVQGEAVPSYAVASWSWEASYESPTRPMSRCRRCIETRQDGDRH